jgi:Major Facilitator Superfamily
MVAYGKEMQRARQHGWENAYLDYDNLKDIISEIESFIFQHTSADSHLLSHDESPFHQIAMPASKTEHLESMKSDFFKALHNEIEKISLFTMKKQGQLADSVGGACFESTGLFETNALNVQFTRDKLDMYAAFGVEMAHLVKYVCLNSIGIEKILKKYSKIFARLDEPQFYVLESNHLKQLASSEGMAAIHGSLQTILDDSYKTENISNPETALALLRFQCILACTTILRRNVMIFQRPFVEFLSKKSMIMTEVNFGGMDAKGQRALRWLLRLEPQRLRQMDQAQLERMWHKWSVQTEIVRAFLDGGLPYGHRRIRTYIGNDALDEMLEAVKLTADEDEKTQTNRKWIWGGVNGPSMLINLFSIMLYTINYYIVAPTANHYAIGLGYDGAFGATLIGASSFSAMFSAFLYSLWYTKSTFKSALIFSALCALVGNLVYALAISYDSMGTAIIGRILCGFGSAEVLNRQLISTCVSFEVMTKASALFVAFGASGMSIGPLIAGILDMTAGRDFAIDISLPTMPAGGIIYNHVTAPGFVMAALWSIQLLCLLLLFQEPKRVNTTENEVHDQSNDTKVAQVFDAPSGDYGSVVLSDRSVEPSNGSRGHGVDGLWSQIRLTVGLLFENTGLPITLLIFSYIEMADEIIISSCSMIVKRYFGWNGSVAGFFIASLGALVLPAHFVVEKASYRFSERRILLVSLPAVAVLISTNLFFRIPTFVAQRSLISIMICTCLLFNYSGLFFDVLGSIMVDDDATEGQVQKVKLMGIKVKDILTVDGEVYYNWGNGIPFYIVSLSLLFMSTIVLEGVDTSIMAKVTPQKLNEQFINVGLLATLIGTLGRVVADSILTGEFVFC